MKYVLDTNIITAYLKGDGIVKQRLQEAELKGGEILINGISYYEIKSGLLAINASNRLEKFEPFCSKFGLLLLDSQKIFDTAANIYANLKLQGNLIQDADILIASVVSLHNYVLISADTDFSRISGLKIENWRVA
jgi:tRNA(fMet)-specific endonuclease VapC